MNEPVNLNSFTEGLLRKTTSEKGYQKAARFLLLLDKETVKRILSHLSEEEIEGIVKEIINLKEVDSKEASRIIQEFGLKIKKIEPKIQGGLGKAREVLKTAIGEDAAEKIIKRIEAKLETNYFNFLHDKDAKVITTLLIDEAPHVIALVLTQLKAGQAAQVISNLSVPVQKDVVKRIATMKNVSPEILRTTADALKKKLFSQGELSETQIDGKKVLANIIKHLNLGQEKMIIDSLEESDPALAQEISKVIYTLESLYKIPGRQLQEFLRKLSDRTLALIIKGEKDAFKKYIWGFLSERRKQMVLEESKLMGSILKKEVNAEKQAVIELLKREIEQGHISLLENDEELVP